MLRDMVFQVGWRLRHTGCGVPREGLEAKVSVCRLTARLFLPVELKCFVMACDADLGPCTEPPSVAEVAM